MAVDSVVNFSQRRPWSPSIYMNEVAAPLGVTFSPTWRVLTTGLLTNSGLIQTQVTAVTGTSPTLDIVLQTSWDLVNPIWSTWVTVAQMTATGEERDTTSALPGHYLRVQATVGGTATPTFDFIVRGLGVEVQQAV